MSSRPDNLSARPAEPETGPGVCFRCGFPITDRSVTLDGMQARDPEQPWILPLVHYPLHAGCALQVSEGLVGQLRQLPGLQGEPAAPPPGAREEERT